MPDTKNIFISHRGEDDPMLPNLKQLITNSGMEIRDYSIDSDNPNNAHNEEYIKREILAPRIDVSSTVVVLINHNTDLSEYVNWEIKYAAEHGKRVVGVLAEGATKADAPEELSNVGDAGVVIWDGDRVIDAINGKITDWDNPQSGESRSPEWAIRRYGC